MYETIARNTLEKNIYMIYSLTFDLNLIKENGTNEVLCKSAPNKFKKIRLNGILKIGKLYDKYAIIENNIIEEPQLISKTFPT